MLAAAFLSLLFIHPVDVHVFWRQLWHFGLLALGVILIQLSWQSRRTAAQLEEGGRGNRQLIFRERLERELTELSTGFINLPLKRIDGAIKHALERVAVICDVDSCSLWLWDDEHRFIKNSYDWHADTVASQNRQWQGMDFNYLPWLRDKLERGVPIHVLSREQLPEEAASEKRFALKTKRPDE